MKKIKTTFEKWMSDPKIKKEYQEELLTNLMDNKNNIYLETEIDLQSIITLDEEVLSYYYNKAKNKKQLAKIKLRAGKYSIVGIIKKDK